jgi:hypothetical protein
MAKPREQADKQADKPPRRTVKSPKNGAEIPLLSKGETANPAGSSAKQRYRAALEKALDEKSADEALIYLVKLARGRKGAMPATIAHDKLARLLGAYEAGDGEGAKPVEVRVTLVSRTDGTEAEIQLAVERENAGPVQFTSEDAQ